MRSCSVEVPHILIEHALELLLVEDQEMVQAFLSHTPQEAFADRIGLWRVIGRFENLNRTRFSHASKARPKFAIVIANQILRYLSIRSSFSERYAQPKDRSEIVSRLRGSPFVTCSSMMKNAKRGRKKRSVTGKRVASPDIRGVIVHKGCPLLASWLGSANSPHVLLNSSLADTNTKFQ
jgi:hypothetical protein